MTNSKEKQREYNKKWRLANLERSRQLSRECQKRWRKNNPYQVKMNKLIRRARIVEARVERVYKNNIWNWESRICGICFKIIKDNADIDHIIPLGRGGTHSSSNLQLAHPFCNKSKFTKLPEEYVVVL